MPPGLKTLCAVTCLLTATFLCADVKAIHTDLLPSDPQLQAALKDVIALEPMVAVWSAEWPYGSSKSKVRDRLSSALKVMHKVAARSAENEELQLLIGLTESYAYNLDVKGSHERALAALDEAGKLAHADFRPEWFIGNHECQTTALSTAGMEKLLAIEAEIAWDQLPAAFWENYEYCAIIKDMPQHALRAASRADKLDPGNMSARASLREAMNNRFKAADPGATYSAREVWFADNDQTSVTFTNYMFGIQFKVPASVGLELPDIQKSLLQFEVKPGPFPGKSGDVSPSLNILSRPPKPGESLAEFLQSAAPESTSWEPSACPVSKCFGRQTIRPGKYKAEGDGHIFIIAFQADEPEFPGLVFEQMQDFPQVKKDKPTSFRLEQRLRRIPGTLYYVIILDTSNSVLAPAENAYLEFIKTVRVD
jgi:tetratricopeptide (TPR) repeat protein